MKSIHPVHPTRRTIKRQAQILVACTMLSLLAAAGLQAIRPIAADAATDFVFLGQCIDPVTGISCDPSHSKWTIPGNWIPQGVPGPNDNAFITEGRTVTGIPAGTVVHGLTLSRGILGGTLFGEPVGDLTVTDVFNWTGGILVVPLTVPAGGVVSITGGTELTTAGLQGTGVLNLAGSTTLSGNLAFGGFDGPAVINNTGIFTAQPGASMFGLACCQNPSRFKNSGTLINDPGGGTTTIGNMELVNTGTIDLMSGVLRVNFSPVPARPAFTEPDGATLRVAIGGTTPATDFGQLQVSGDRAALGGNLVVTNVRGFTPAAGQTFKVVTCSTACNGTFQLASAFYTALYHPQDVTLITSGTADTDLALSGVPADITVNATSSSGAVVTYPAPTAVDEAGESPTASCSPASGSTFAIGTTTVTCTASDSDDAPSTVSQTFTVTVNDTDLALSGVPANMTVNATGPLGATVNYALPTVSDEDATLPMPACSPASGTTFAIGTTTVNCAVSDADDSNSPVNASFMVTVKGASAQLVDLSQAVQGVGPGTSLGDKVQSAQSFLASGDVADTCSTLTAFINEVTAQSGKSIPVAQASQLIADAQRIQAVLAC